MKEHSIASRHIQSFLLLIALPVLIFMFVSGYIFRQEIIDMTAAQRDAAISTIADSVNAELERMSIVASSLIHNRNLMNRSLEYVKTSSSEQRYEINFALEDIFNTYFLLSKQLAAYYLFFSDNSEPFVSRNYYGVNLSSSDAVYYSHLAAAVPGSVIFPDALASNNGEQMMVSLAVTPPEYMRKDTGAANLVITFVLNELNDFIRQKYDNSGTSAISHTFLTGRNGIVLASNNRENVGLHFSEINGSFDKKYIVRQTPINASDWTLIEAIDIRSLTQRVDIILNILFTAMVFVALLFIGYNFFFFRRILKPINIVISKMSAVAKGDFSVKVPSSSFAEMNRLNESFNFMVAEIGSLTQEIKKEQKERLKTEIDVLRYQLNPHFLCNTLNSIRMMALITKNDAIQKMSTALMTITEDTLGREDTICSLERELKNLDSYVYIMKVRYGETFEFIRDVDSSLLSLGIPSMILQPLVENAILHGFRGGARSGVPGTIVVSASQKENALLIEVRDDGKVMSAEHIENLFHNERSSEKGFTKIGLSAVKRRIQLSYGAPYTLEIVSYQGEGTVVTLLLPILEASEYDSRMGRTEND
ncbi:MAG: histidine kinase [Treponema sp.]|jgi:two-component system sensor histidine kinase YesM|nr:histidine kinase [Treponema sp.]